MIIHNPILTGSFTVNGTDVASITSSAASITAINSYTASQNILNGTYTLTSSFAAQTASFTAFTSSVNSFTASQLVLNGTYATTGSNTFKNPQTINSNLIVTGSITAATLVVQTITSSVIYSSGSNVFGNNIANTQVMTGSIYITGSIGIGTNLPTALLHLSSSTSTAAHIHAAGTANYASLNLTNNTTGYGYDVGMGGSTSIAPNCFYIYGGATASVRLAVASGGNVGIGTVYPSASLEVSGSVYVGGNTSNSNYKFLVKRGTDRNMGIGLQGTDLSVEFVNDIYTANVPTRIYANPLSILGGNVGIGTTSPTNISGYGGLTINGTSGAYTYWNINGTDTGRIITDSTNMYFDNVSTGALVFRTTNSSTERMRITSAGAVSIGNDSYSPSIQFKTGGSTSYAGIISTNSNVDYLILNGGSSSGYNNGGQIILIGADRYGTSTAGQITIAAGNAANNTGFGHIAFETAQTERMRVTYVGSVLLGTTTSVNDVRLQVAASPSTWISATIAGTGNTDKVVIGNYTGTGPAIGGHNSGLTGWSTLSLNFGGGAVYAGTLRIDNNSDQRFKKNITSVENALDTILKLQGRKFNMIDEDNILRYGFVAQEVQPHLSDFVTESTREHKDENVHITNLLTLETSGAAWAALLVEAIKELQAQITELKNK